VTADHEPLRRQAHNGALKAAERTQYIRSRGVDTIQAMFIPDISAVPTAVHVIVDHIPSVGGPSLWLTTLVSTIVGMLSASVMEVIKPLISRKQLKSKMLKELLGELNTNLQMLEPLDRMSFTGSIDPENPPDVDELTYYLARIGSGVFRHYIQHETMTLFELDSVKHLQEFYDLATDKLSATIERARKTNKDEDRMWVELLMKDMMGHGRLFADPKRRTLQSPIASMPIEEL
jgi:hypothetical protein